MYRSILWSSVDLKLARGLIGDEYASIRIDRNIDRSLQSGTTKVSEVLAIWSVNLDAP